MTVRTTYFGGIGGDAHPADHDLVLGVVRYPADFVDRVVDRNVPAVAPLDDLLDAYKTVEATAEQKGDPNPSEIAWRSVEFERRYRKHLERPGPKTVLGEIRKQLLERDVWLVCWEKDVRWCHRRILAEVLVDGIDVDVQHHPPVDELEALDEDVDDEPTDATLSEFVDRELRTDGAGFRTALSAVETRTGPEPVDVSPRGGSNSDLCRCTCGRTVNRFVNDRCPDCRQSLAGEFGGKTDV